MANKTRSDLQHDVFLLLNETNATALGELESGVDATPTQSALLSINEYADQVIAFCCWNLPFIEGWVKYTSLPIGTFKLLMHNATFTGNMGRSTLGDSSVMMWPRAAKWNGVTLTPCSLEAIRLNYADVETPPNGTPLYWYLTNNWFNVYPAPVAAQQLELYGTIAPQSIAAGSEDIPYLTFARARAIAVGTAALLARDNIDDVSVKERIAPLAAEFDAFAGQEWDRIPMAIKKTYYQTLPFLLGGEKPNRPIGGKQ